MSMTNPESSFSISAFARIPTPQGDFFFIRNAGTLHRTGETVYSPIGGAVAISAGQGLPKELAEFQPIPERETLDGMRDLRYRLGKPAETEEEQEKLFRGVEKLTADHLNGSVSLVREICEELTLEEKLVSPDDMGPLSIQHQHSHDVVISEENRLDPSAGNRLYGFQVYDVKLPAKALSALIRREREDRESPAPLLKVVTIEEMREGSRRDIPSTVAWALLNPAERE